MRVLLDCAQREDCGGRGDERGHLGEQCLGVRLGRLEASRLAQFPPLVAVAVVSCPSRTGRSAVVLPKKLASSCRLTSRTIPSPTTCSAAGGRILGELELIMDSAASFFGVTRSPVIVPSVAGISAPSATKLACESVNTTGIRRSCVRSVSRSIPGRDGLFDYRAYDELGYLGWCQDWASAAV